MFQRQHDFLEEFCFKETSKYMESKVDDDKENSKNHHMVKLCDIFCGRGINHSFENIS